MTSDPIADMLTRVRNAIRARHPKVDVPASKLKTEIARILKEEGFITNFKVAEEGAKKTIKIYLKYASNNSPVISARRRVANSRLICCSGDCIWATCSSTSRRTFSRFFHSAHCVVLV